MQCPRGLPDPWLAEGCRHIECRDGSRDTKEKGRGRGAGAFSSPKFAPVAGPEHGTLRRSHAAAQAADFRHGMKDHLVANVAPCDRPVEKWRHRFLLARTPDAGPSGGSEPLGKLPMAGMGRGGRRACGPSGFAGLQLCLGRHAPVLTTIGPRHRRAQQGRIKRAFPWVLPRGTRSGRWHLRPVRSFPQGGGIRWRRTNAVRCNDKGTAQVQGSHARRPQYSG
jgi:hypothetical protein